jgi:hypothetical protein
LWSLAHRARPSRLEVSGAGARTWGSCLLDALVHVLVAVIVYVLVLVAEDVYMHMHMHLYVCFHMYM